MRRPLVVGNWKMHGSSAENRERVAAIAAGASECHGVDIAICPPAVYLQAVGAQLAGSGVALGAQNLCEQTRAGAFTGELLGAMLADVGCRYVIVGHSERRTLYGEDDSRVAEKFAAAAQFGLQPVLCIGETLAERDAGTTEAVLARQLDAVLRRTGVAAFGDAVIAYEPVWSIGTGRNAAPEQVQSAHAFIRGRLARLDATIANQIALLYGGSVKPNNAAALFDCADVDGGLIGGASLHAGDFLAIARAAATAS
ncbi:MAG: triose-phosphate isomerase [Gammaproteobacteria bacterium]|nr:triose-phosphate isomerase [Gammaproteobacteria bacterium]